MKMYGAVEVQILVFLILAPDGVGDQLHTLSTLLSQEDPLLQDIFPLLLSVQTGCRSHLTASSLGIRGCFLDGKWEVVCR